MRASPVKACDATYDVPRPQVCERASAATRRCQRCGRQRLGALASNVLQGPSESRRGDEGPPANIRSV